MAIRTITKLIAERRQEEDGILSAAKQKDGQVNNIGVADGS